jgi:hypothetical protein
MSRHFNIKITGGTSEGLYSIYYNNVVNSNLAQTYPVIGPASGLTLSSLTTGLGVSVVVPNNATTVILYNNKCNVSQTYNVGPYVPPSQCFCLTIIRETHQVQLQFCSNGSYSGGKPIYVATSGMNTYYTTWNSNNHYWEVSPISDFPSVFIRSTDPDNIPLSPWSAYGNNPQSYNISAIEGDCKPITLTYSIKCNPTNPSCAEISDGSIIAIATGGAGGWKYSLDGIVFTNTTGVFTGLPNGQYTVFGKDLNGNITQCTSYLNAPQTATYPLQVNVVSNSYLTTSNNYKMYKLDYFIDTTTLPIGDVITFDFKITYSLSYTKPGTVYFDTTQHSLNVNSVSKPIYQVGASVLSIAGVSSCNPIYETYSGVDVYKATTVTIQNGDTVNGYILYGINTESAGVFDGTCITKGTVSVNAIAENIITQSPCDVIAPSGINVGQTQTFTP